MWRNVRPLEATLFAEQRKRTAHGVLGVSNILSVENGRNFEMLAQLLGRGTEMPRTPREAG
jgi:hypothetical protein